MPTAFYYTYTDQSDKIVKLNLVDEIDNYINNPNIELTYKGRYRKDYCKDEKIYHISATAIDLNNHVMLKAVLKYVDLANTYNDGNCFNLLQLALNNYYEDYEDDVKKEKNYETIMILLEHAKNTNYNSATDNESGGFLNTGYIFRLMIKHLDNYDDWALFDLLRKVLNPPLNNCYHYSIAWSYKKVFEKLVNNYLEFINISDTKSSIESAEYFKDYEMREYVTKFLLSKNITF